MSEDGDDERFEILWGAVVAAFKKSHSLGGPVKHLRASGRYSEGEELGLARLGDDVQHVGDERFVHVDLGNRLLDFDYVGGVERWAQVFELSGSSFCAQDLAFGVAFGISHANPHQKTVKLRFGQRIGTVMLDRILGSYNEERLRQQVGLRVDGDLALVHGLEQGGL